MEYLIVKFPEPRKVVVNGLIQGSTGMILSLEAGTHTIALEPSARCRPLRQIVTLVGTSPIKPSEVRFELTVS